MITRNSNSSLRRNQGSGPPHRGAGARATPNANTPRRNDDDGYLGYTGGATDDSCRDSGGGGGGDD